MLTVEGHCGTVAWCVNTHDPVIESGQTPFCYIFSPSKKKIYCRTSYYQYNFLLKSQVCDKKYMLYLYALTFFFFVVNHSILRRVIVIWFRDCF